MADGNGSISDREDNKSLDAADAGSSGSSGYGLSSGPGVQAPWDRPPNNLTLDVINNIQATIGIGLGIGVGLSVPGIGTLGIGAGLTAYAGTGNISGGYVGGSAQGKAQAGPSSYTGSASGTTHTQAGKTNESFFEKSVYGLEANAGPGKVKGGIIDTEDMVGISLGGSIGLKEGKIDLGRGFGLEAKLSGNIGVNFEISRENWNDFVQSFMDDQYDPNTVPGYEPGSGYYGWPVVLDLDGDGLDLVALDKSKAFYDIDGDGYLENVGWVGDGDGFLSIDLNGDGLILEPVELAFALSTDDPNDTDLEGLAATYDTNKDGVLDAQDADFAKFKVWRDIDQDGVCDAGEVKSLAEHGITSINLTSDKKEEVIAGNKVYGSTTYTKTDGTTRSVGDVDFKIAGKGNKPTAIDDEDGDDEDAAFVNAARQALTGKIASRLPEMSTSGNAIAMAA